MNTDQFLSQIGLICDNLVFLSGMVYFTVASQGSVQGAIKRAYIPSVDDGSNNIAAAVPLDIKYITTPDGIAVDWVGRCVCSSMVSIPQLHFYVVLISHKNGETCAGFYCVSETTFHE